MDNCVGPTFHQATILGEKAIFFFFFFGSKKPEKLHSADRILAQGLVTWYTHSTIRTDVKCIYPRRGTCFHVMQSFELEAWEEWMLKLLLLLRLGLTPTGLEIFGFLRMTLNHWLPSWFHHPHADVTSVATVPGWEPLETVSYVL